MTLRRHLPSLAAVLTTTLLGACPWATVATAQNPLVRAKQRAAHAFAGVFTGAGVRLELQWKDAAARYEGSILVDGASYPATATERDGGIAGAFVDEGESYAFTLRPKGANFVLASEGQESELVREGGGKEPAPVPTPTPTPAPAPAPGAAPCGVGIAFSPRGDDLVVAQLLPDGPAAKAHVPVGAVLRAIDGRKTQGMSQEQVRAALGGAAGTLVTVTLETATEVLDCVIARAPLAGAPPGAQPGQAGTQPATPFGGGDAPAGELPAWLRTGARATYFSGSAQIPGVAQSYTEDDDGNIDIDGRRYKLNDLQGSGGAGYTQYDFVAVAPEVIAVSCANFVFADAQLSTLARTGTQAFVGDRTGLGDLWVPPAKLLAMQEEEAPDHRVRRLRYPLDGRTYDALTTQIRDQNGYTRYTYDLATGLMLVHSHCSVGKAALTPTGNGTAGYGQGVTTIVHGHLRSLRALALPWTGQATPPWCAPGARLEYRGTMRNSLAEGVCAPWAYGFAVAADRAVGAGVLATLSTMLDYGAGQPPQTTTGQVAYGPGSPIPLWLDARAVQRLQPGQVLDKDPVTGNQIAFVGSDGATATIAEQGALEQQSYTYDLQSGRLVATSVRTKQGPAVLAIDVQLAR